MRLSNFVINAQLVGEPDDGPLKYITPYLAIKADEVRVYQGMLTEYNHADTAGQHFVLAASGSVTSENLSKSNQLSLTGSFSGVYDDNIDSFQIHAITVVDGEYRG